MVRFGAAIVLGFLVCAALVAVNTFLFPSVKTCCRGHPLGSTGAYLGVIRTPHHWRSALGHRGVTGSFYCRGWHHYSVGCGCRWRVFPL